MNVLHQLSGKDDANDLQNIRSAKASDIITCFANIELFTILAYTEEWGTTLLIICPKQN